jgi:hypothetical protein
MCDSDPSFDSRYAPGKGVVRRMCPRPRRLVQIVVGCLLLTVLGCASLPAQRYRAHPEFETRSTQIHTAGILSPDIKIYELTAGGIRELRDDWCKIGKETVGQAAGECFSERQVQVKILPIEKESEEELEDILALYRAVSRSILSHTYGDNPFPEKVKRFEYSIGPIDSLLKRWDSDALVLIMGFDEISTSGRKALTAAAMVLGALTGVVMLPGGGLTVVNMAVVDPSGNILWYNVRGSHGGHDLRDPESTRQFLKSIVSDFPGLKK